MSVYIELNHKDIESAASKIEDNIKEMNKIKGSAESQVGLLKGAWDGSDSEEFKHSFEGDSGVLATIKNACDRLQVRADFLKFCADVYKSAQSDAVNKARKL